jgi:hypothetical protein
MRKAKNMNRRLVLKALTVSLGAALLLSACGGNRIVLNLDMDSFMSVDERSFEYIGINPGGNWEHRSPLETIATPEGLKEVAELEEMLVDLKIDLDNSQVSAGVAMNVSLEVYLASSQTGIWEAQNRFVTLDGNLDGGALSSLEGVFPADDFLELFQSHDQLYVGLWLHLEHVSGMGIIQGTAELTRLHLHVEARENLL